MDITKIMLIINAVSSAAAKLHDDTNGAVSFDAAIAALATAAAPSMPKKADGTAFTDADVRNAATAARAPWQRVIAKLERS